MALIDPVKRQRRLAIQEASQTGFFGSGQQGTTSQREIVSQFKSGFSGMSQEDQEAFQTEVSGIQLGSRATSLLQGLDKEIVAAKKGLGSRPGQITIRGITVGPSIGVGAGGGGERSRLEREILQQALSPAEFAQFQQQQTQKNQNKISGIQAKLDKLEAQAPPVARGQQRQANLTQTFENRKNRLRSQLNSLTFGAAGLEEFDPEAKLSAIGQQNQKDKIARKLREGKITSQQADQRTQAIDLQAQFESGDEQAGQQLSALNQQRVASGDIAIGPSGTTGTPTDTGPVSVSSVTGGQVSTTPLPSGPSPADASQLTSTLLGQGLGVGVIEARLRRDGLSDDEIQQALSSGQQLAAAQATGDPAQISAATEQVNLITTLGGPGTDFSLFAPELITAGNISTINATGELIEMAQANLGPEADAFLAGLSNLTPARLENALVLAQGKLRNLQIEAKITKDQAREMSNFLNDMASTQRDDTQRALLRELGLLTEEKDEIERRGDIDIADSRAAQSKADIRTKAMLGRLGALDSTDAQRIVGQVSSEYERIIENKKATVASDIREVIIKAEDASEKARIADQEVTNWFNSQMVTLTTNTNNALLDIQSRVFDTVNEKNQEIADIYTDQASQISLLLQDQFEFNRDLARDISKDSGAGALALTSDLANGQTLAIGGINATITGIDGSGPGGWANGFDAQFPGGKVPIEAPVAGTVTRIANDPDGFGNFIEVDIGNGQSLRISHLDSTNVQVGQRVGPGTGIDIGVQGNSGKTSDGKGGFQIDGGTDPARGIHVDYTVFDSAGNPLTARDAAAIVSGRSRVGGRGTITKTSDQISQENTLRDDLKQRSGEFVKVRDAFNRVQVSATDPSAAGDLSLIFNFMKMLDPGSVVRESEFATAANAGAVPEIIRGQFNRVQKGERLSDVVRNDFLDRSKSLFSEQSSTQQRLVDQFTGLAERQGLDIQSVILDLDPRGAVAPTPQTSGQILNNSFDDFQFQNPPTLQEVQNLLQQEGFGGFTGPQQPVQVGPTQGGFGSGQGQFIA